MDMVTTLQEVLGEEKDEEVFYNIKLRKRDFQFVKFLATELRQPRVKILELTISLLCLAILKPDEVYDLFQQTIEQIKRGQHEHQYSD